MSSALDPLRLPPLQKHDMALLQAQAKSLRLTPERYARQLVEEGLALQHEAETKTLAEIMSPVRKAAGAVDEAEIFGLVEKARRSGRAGKMRSANGKKR